VITALAHVIVTEGLLADEEPSSPSAATPPRSRNGASFVAQPEQRPRPPEAVTGVPAPRCAPPRACSPPGGNGAIYYGLGVTEHSQGSTTVMGIANLAMATGNVGREGVGVNPLRGQNNVQGACDMGSFPHELPGYRHVSDSTTRAFEAPGA
jgi:formate dehydrogenase major subunit